jgi:hypothetical protein
MAQQQDPSGFDALQQAFGSSEPFRTAFSEHCASFWRGQDRILDSMQDFASGWFMRRHEAARTAIETAQRAGTAHSPADAMREWQTWMTGSMQRMTADGMACQKHLMAVVQCASSAAASAAHMPDVTVPQRPASETAAQHRKAA